MSDVAIRVENICKEYHIGATQAQQDTLGAQMIDTFISPFRRAGKLLRGQATGAAELDQSLWALHEVSFDVMRGDVVGIVGRNGAGKSTLLKILSRITDPTKGRITIYGRVGSLLEVGTGFHPELTGRENIFLNGAILGMRKREIERQFDAIVDFAELAQFIDTPVKHYSSGMYVRLAFSVAAHLEPEILLVDEVLAVGDIAFQRKCLGKMDDVAQQGRTVLFVSHNMALMQSLCERGVFLHQGRMMKNGTITEAVEVYLQTLAGSDDMDLATRSDRKGGGLIKVTKVEISDGSAAPQPILRTGHPARFVFEVDNVIQGMSFGFVFFNYLGQRVAVFKSDEMGDEDSTDETLNQRFVCEFDKLLLLPGRYHINVFIRGAGEMQDFIESAVAFDVHPGDLDGRPADPNKVVSVVLPHRWRVPTKVSS